jgi:hypothetical protein
MSGVLLKFVAVPARIQRAARSLLLSFWRLFMSDREALMRAEVACSIAREGISAPDGNALASRPGAAKPPLDLSQGHFATSHDYVDGDEVDVAKFGPFTLVVDYRQGRALKLLDRGALPDWLQRRRAKHEFDQKVERIIAGTGLVASWGRL